MTPSDERKIRQSIIDLRADVVLLLEKNNELDRRQGREIEGIKQSLQLIQSWMERMEAARKAKKAKK